MSDPNPVINRLKTHSSGRPIVDWYLEEEGNDIRLCAQVGDSDEYNVLTVSKGVLTLHTMDERMLASLGLRKGDTWGHGWSLPKLEDDEEGMPIGYIRRDAVEEGE